MTKRTIALIVATLVIAPASAPGSQSRPASPVAPAVGGITSWLPASPVEPGLERMQQIALALTTSETAGGSGMIAVSPDARALTGRSPSGPAASSSSEETGANWGWALPIGDADGDLITDMVTLEGSYEWDRIVARDGRTAASRWMLEIRRPRVVVTDEQLYFLVWVDLMDTDLDGVLDVLVTHSTVRGEPDLPSVGSDHAYTLLDGRTGQTRWTWSARGYRYEDPATGLVVRENHPWNFAVNADVTGDGVPDPFVQLCSSIAPQGAGGINPREQGSCRVLHIDAATGVEAESFPIPAGTSAFSVRDVTGDDLGDVITAHTYPYISFEMEARSADGTPHWRTHVPYHDWFWVWSLNLLGEGSNNVVTWGFDFESNNWSPDALHMRALARDGSTAWARALPIETRLLFVPDIDGDGGTDLAYYDVSGDAARVTLYDGATFTERLWRRTMEVEAPPGMDLVSGPSLIEDLNSDGAHEITLSPVLTTEETWEPLGTEAYDGRTGDPLWSLGPSEPEISSVGVAGDVNLDDRQDVFRNVSSGGSWRLEILDGETLAPIWTGTPSSQHAYVAYAVNLAPAAGNELIVFRSGGGMETIAGEGPDERFWELIFRY